MIVLFFFSSRSSLFFQSIVCEKTFLVRVECHDLPFMVSHDGLLSFHYVMFFFFFFSFVIVVSLFDRTVE